MKIMSCTYNCCEEYYYKRIFVVSIIILFIIIQLSMNKLNCRYKYFDTSKENINFDISFDYIHYQADLVTEKMKNESGWILNLNTVFFINGLIRKHKPKNCLEIGVARGGSSILILNAIKDLPDSRLVSMDLNILFKKDRIGYLVEKNFPELMGKWSLFIGDMPHKFLSKLNIKYDFLFLDTAHTSPGEFFNLIEVLPFLKEKAIVVLHDTIWHLHLTLRTNKKLNEIKVMPTQIYLMSSLIGEKILINHDLYGFENVGAIRLAEKQQNYYLNYFLLLMNVWQYMPSNKHLIELREFIKKYYKKKIYLRIFDVSLNYNKRFFNNLIEGRYKLNNAEK